VCVALALSGCGVLSPSRRIFDQYSRLEAERVEPETQRWAKLVGEGATTDDAVQAGAHLRLALLYSHPDNPEPRLDLALDHLASYSELDPKGAQDIEIRRLREILDDLSRCVLRGERRKEVSDLLWKEEQEVSRRLEALRRDSRSMSQVVELLVEEELSLRRQNQALKERNERLEKTSQELTSRNKELTKSAEGLMQQNEELKATIEQLKKLDLQMEQIRSGTGSP